MAEKIIPTKYVDWPASARGALNAALVGELIDKVHNNSICCHCGQWLPRHWICLDTKHSLILLAARKKLARQDIVFIIVAHRRSGLATRCHRSSRGLWRWINRNTFQTLHGLHDSV